MSAITVQHLEPLQQLINERYDGNLRGMLHHLNEAMYMLNFIEEDAFGRSEIQNIAYTLRNLQEGLQKVQEASASEVEKRYVSMVHVWQEIDYRHAYLEPIRD